MLPCRIWALRLEEVEQTWSDRLSAAVASASSKVEDFKQRQSMDAAKAAEVAALNAAEAESRYMLVAGASNALFKWLSQGAGGSSLVYVQRWQHTLEITELVDACVPVITFDCLMIAFAICCWP
jgi:hypothetical protein